MIDGAALGAQLAERHQAGGPADLDRNGSLLNHAEVLREGDWSLRSALTRLAQPDPRRAGAVLDLMRRCDYALSHLQRGFEAHLAICDWSLRVDAGRLPDAQRPYSDGRVADLARLVRILPASADALVAGYQESSSGLSAEERHAIPLLVGVLALDELADVLAAWASRGHVDPPLEFVDGTCERLAGYLDLIGVPLETGPPWSGRRGAEEAR